LPVPIVRLAELVHWVNTNCIDPGKNPKKQYLEFKEEVNHLGTVLTDFEDAILQALSQLHDYDPVTGLQQHDSLIQQAHKLIQPFVSTLEESQRLLQTYIKYDSRHGSFLESVSWHTSTQAKVDELRQRIRDHTDKISLFINCVALKVNTQTSEKTRQIHDKVVRSVGETTLPSIPNGFEEKLVESLSRYPNSQISHSLKISLEEGIDTMLIHFQKCTALSPETNSGERYLHLLTAHWLQKTLLKSDAFEQSTSGLYCSRIVEKMEQPIAEQYQQEDIRQYMERPALGLNILDWEIWFQEDRSPI
jgi:hypothetical protein